MSDFITISSSALPDNTRVAAFRATETISRPYEVEVFLLVPSDELELADGIGSKARLILDRSDDKLPPFYFSGVFASLELLHEFDGRVLVRGIIVPRIWQLGLSHHSRMFTKMSVREIIEAVLGDNSLSGDDYELRLGSYSKEEHVCQYRESDLAFLSRWMEREGIYYFFEHSDEGEKLIICDDKSYDKDVIGTPVRYHPQSGGDMSAGASFRSFRCRYATLPATVKLKDYDYAKPNLDVSGVAPVSDAGTAEVSIYGDRFFSPADGKRIAQLRAESYKAREVVYQALGTRLHVRPGYIFELEDHPRAAFNAEYLAIEVTHSGNQATGGGGFREFITMEHDDVYLVEVSAIPAKTQFRAERSTPWPRIYGYENGVIDGSAESEYAQIDDQGRYSVKFKFDESALKSGKASTFVRMMQPHGGAIEGFHFPLRKGTEVVLNFLGGDPDRPVIAGVVPNTLLPSPVTSSNHTRNVIQTGGRNRMEFEDLSGQQWIHQSTPYEKTYIRLGLPFDGVHEMHFQTDKDTLLNSGQNFDLKVGQIAGNGTWDALIKNHWHTYVQDGGVSIGVKLTPLAPAGGKYTIEALSDITSHTTTGNFKLDVDTGTWITNVDKDTTWTIKTGNTKIDTKAGTTQILSKGKVTVDSWNDAMDIHANAKIFINSVTEQIYVKADTLDVKIEGKSNVHIESMGPMTIKAAGDITQEGAGKWYAYSVGDYFKFNLSSSVALTVALTSETKIGLTNDNFIGGKVELTIAAKLAISLALSLECNMGLTVKNKVGPAEIEYRNASIKAVSTKLENNLGPTIKSAIMRLQRAGVHIALG